MKEKILVDAVFINNSGGKVLLDILVAFLSKTKLEVYYLLDLRIKGQYNFLKEDEIIYLEPSLFKRHQFYKQYGNDFVKVLCFGNIPPTVRLRAKVYTYFHNVLLLTQPVGYPIKDKLLKKIKGGLINYYKDNSDFFIVQSENVKQELERRLRIKSDKCLVIPFYHSNSIESVNNKDRSGFIYVSNGNPHKNHERLLQAWSILHNSGFKETLYLTVSDLFPHIKDRIEKLESEGVRIKNLGIISKEELDEHYDKRRYLIYPSLCESFGLGLVEAIERGCEVIASDMPYVHSIVKPLATFNPNSAKSIADVVLKTFSLTSEKLISEIKIDNSIDELINVLHP